MPRRTGSGRAGFPRVRAAAAAADRPEPHRRSAPSSSGCVRAREAQARRSRPRPAQRLREFAVSFSSPHLFCPEWLDLRKGGVIENGE